MLQLADKLRGFNRVMWRWVEKLPGNVTNALTTTLPNTIANVTLAIGRVLGLVNGANELKENFTESGVVKLVYGIDNAVDRIQTLLYQGNFSRGIRRNLRTGQRLVDDAIGLVGWFVNNATFEGIVSRSTQAGAGILRDAIERRAQACELHVASKPAHWVEFHRRMQQSLPPPPPPCAAPNVDVIFVVDRSNAPAWDHTMKHRVRVLLRDLIAPFSLAADVDSTGTRMGFVEFNSDAYLKLKLWAGSAPDEETVRRSLATLLAAPAARPAVGPAAHAAASPAADLAPPRSTPWRASCSNAGPHVGPPPCARA